MKKNHLFKRNVFGLCLLTAMTSLILTSCSSGTNNSDRAKRFDTVLEMRDAYIKAGGSCPDWKLSNVTLAIGSGTCSDSNVLSIYSSRDVANEQNSSMKNYTLKLFPDSVNDRLTLLVGENWILNDSDSDVLLKFQQEHGGDLITSYSQIS